MARSWAELPTGRVICLAGAGREALALSLESLPAGAPAVLTYAASAAPTASAMVESVLSELETAAVALYPAWLPDAEGIEPGGAGVGAVRALALRMASGTHHFGPFVADLAQASLTGQAPGPTRFPAEVRAAGLARVLAAAFGRRQVALLVDVPEGLSARDEDVLVAGCEWLAHRSGMGVWLTGARVVRADRLETVAVRLPEDVAAIARDVPETSVHAAVTAHTPAGSLPPVTAHAPAGSLPPVTADAPADSLPPVPADAPAGSLRPIPARTETSVRKGPDGRGHGASEPRTGEPAIGYPAVTGRPHPASAAEQALERALASSQWAAGRAWNQTHRSHALARTFRLDLLWREERCVVEVDGPEHREAVRFEADRRRDVQLQLDGFAVLRFTNDQIASDLAAVVRQLERFVTSRRTGTFEGSHHG
ncbi:endonuclease domain-containing protein [Planotetraspora phitsanulokensis]|uniref:DUF559 domain-containing protein n=1 Tax=Planotetraspora phitsanulokensis TaxID=575192 RepID=A0A8J3UFC6_9ACTN|nr:DUF559 domain-containing protein [Planotetraspora phitsanulokensis]GII42256.1 hypothetical protein Pph01_72590 [Planotetraspora phitsanulokensis]